MTIRKLKGRFEVKMPLVPNQLLVLTCDSLKHAKELDKIGRIHEKVVNKESCDLGELEAALVALEATGTTAASPLHDRLVAKAMILRARQNSTGLN
jgi:hypothetical protein